MNIGGRLKSIREKKSLSQYQLSALAKVPRSTLIRIEQGEVEPRISTLVKIAKSLDIKIEEFLS